jgi:DNA binding domain, excisionase family
MNNKIQEKVSIENKFALTVKEAAEYFNIGEHRIRELTDKKNCPFVLWVGSKRLVKRKKFEEYLSVQYSV